MKRISGMLAIVISFVVLFSSFVMPVSAADVNYSVTSASGKKGDTVTVSVRLSSNVPIWGGIVTLGFNSSELEYVSHSSGGVIASGNPYRSGSKITFAGSYSGTSGTVFTVRFKILKASGTSTLTLSTSENINNDGATLSASASGGKITITAPATETTSQTTTQPTTQPTTRPSGVPVTSVKLNKTNVTLKKDESTTLIATVTPNNATNKTVTFTSSNTKVAKVDSNGKVTAVGGGKATITAKADGKTATCTVNVNVAQTGIKAYGSTTRKAAVGDSIRLSVLKVPADATDDLTTTWTSSNNSIATVSSNGVVKALATGTVNITAKTKSWTVVYKFTIEEKKDESTTVDESSTEETTEVGLVIVETTTEETTTEEPTTNEASFIERIKNHDRYLLTVIGVSVAAAVLILVTVLILVLKNRSDRKKKEEELEKQKLIIEEKRDR